MQTSSYTKGICIIDAGRSGAHELSTNLPVSYLDWRGAFAGICMECILPTGEVIKMTGPPNVSENDRGNNNNIREAANLILASVIGIYEELAGKKPEDIKPEERTRLDKLSQLIRRAA